MTTTVMTTAGRDPQTNATTKMVATGTMMIGTMIAAMTVATAKVVTEATEGTVMAAEMAETEAMITELFPVLW